MLLLDVRRVQLCCVWGSGSGGGACQREAQTSSYQDAAWALSAPGALPSDVKQGRGRERGMSAGRIKSRLLSVRDL